MTPCLCTGRADIRCDEGHCDLAGPGRPHYPDECRVCWLRLGQPVPPEPGPWPLTASLLARMRHAGDKGLGDTLARQLARVGGERFKAIYRRLMGRDCGCESRQAHLNARFPYPPPE